MHFSILVLMVPSKKNSGGGNGGDFRWATSGIELIVFATYDASAGKKTEQTYQIYQERRKNLEMINTREIFT